MTKKRESISNKLKKMTILQYYEFKRTFELHPDAQYYIIYGERSNGKSYSALKFLIEEFFGDDIDD